MMRCEVCNSGYGVGKSGVEIITTVKAGDVTGTSSGFQVCHEEGEDRVLSLLKFRGTSHRGYRHKKSGGSHYLRAGSQEDLGSQTGTAI